MTRVTLDISDISDAPQLIRYALAAELDLLAEDHQITQTAVARALGKDRAYLTHVLEGHPKNLSPEHLRDLDETFVALAPAVGETGGLSSLNMRLRGLSDSTSLVARAPCAWAREILERPPHNELDVLIQASALLAIFMKVEKAERGGVRAIRQRYDSEIRELVDKFILIGGAPPTPRNTDALALFGGLAKYSFDSTHERLTEALRSFPLGFRMWRTITALAQLSTKTPALAGRVQIWVRNLLEEAEQLRAVNVYPGRSLDVELATALPCSWSPPGAEDWVHHFLIARARSETATVAERSTAAHGLWKRAFVDDSAEYQNQVKDELASVIEDFRSTGNAGLRWAAATLEHLLEGNEPVCNDWPDTQETWLQVVHEAADSLERQEIPENIRPAIKSLFAHTLLQNGCVERREAIDTLVAGGWTEPVVKALGSTLAHEKAAEWLRIRALFALGFLQRRDLTVAKILNAACREAWNTMTKDDCSCTTAKINEMHAALFAIGDCFGVETPGMQRAKNEVRGKSIELLRPLLVDGSTAQRGEYWPIARAAAYMLTATASDRLRPDRKDVAQELLEVLSGHPDPTTRNFSQWALSFRFAAEDGKVQPLLHGPAVPVA